MLPNPSPNASSSAPLSDRFSSTGFILAAIGSAVGLGNMWKFPYITGKYGGAAFFLVFIACLLFVGLPILLAEMAIGRGGRGNAVRAFTTLSGSKYWGAFGSLAVIGSFAIMSYYGVIAGWTLHYSLISATGTLFESADYTGTFGSFVGGYTPLFWATVAFLITGLVIGKGISGGIEKFNKLLIPALAALLVILMIRALTLPGAGAGVEFFLKPDFSKLTTESFLIALGHAFFSLSLGMGTMLTYGTYVHRQQSLVKATFAIGGGDLMYALVAGLIIFPTIFSYNIEPGQGPGLVFMALPAAFAAMPLGNLFGFLFFILLAVAALTSAVSLLEVPVAWAMHKLNLSRKAAAFWVTLLCFLVGIPSALSFGPLSDFAPGGKTYFDWFDFVSSNILLPIGGLIVTLFTGYAWKKAGEEAGLTGFWYKVWMFLLRFIAPLFVVAIFLHSLGILKFE
jgi:NSS family neurotransmitter:Na+ symporter